MWTFIIYVPGNCPLGLKYSCYHITLAPVKWCRMSQPHRQQWISIETVDLTPLPHTSSLLGSIKQFFYNYISQRRVISTATASLRHCRLSHCERTGCKYDSLKLKNAVSKTFCMANALNHRYILTVFKNVIRSYTNKNIFAIVLEKNNFVELVITKTLLDFDIHVLV